MNTLNQEDGNELELLEDELTSLKARADVLGIKYHPNIKLDSLRSKVSEKLSNKPAATSPDETDEDTAPVVETQGQARRRVRAEALKLIRVRVTCLNPAKKEWEGEIFTVGNSLIGSLTKYVPFDSGEDGYHIPQILLNQMKQRQCQIFYTVKDDKGNKVRKGKLIKEFGIEILPPLTKAELDELATQQALARAID